MKDKYEFHGETPAKSVSDNGYVDISGTKIVVNVYSDGEQTHTMVGDADQITEFVENHARTTLEDLIKEGRAYTTFRNTGLREEMKEQSGVVVAKKTPNPDLSIFYHVGGLEQSIERDWLTRPNLYRKNLVEGYEQANKFLEMLKSNEGKASQNLK